MVLTPLTTLTWAYQLHYYTCFRTHLRRQVLTSNEQFLKAAIKAICTNEEIHLLELQTLPEQVRTIISLRPDQTVAKCLQAIKPNSSRIWNTAFKTKPPLWARGYFAQSVGQVRTDAVSKYLDEQPSHHGYDRRIHPPVYRFCAERPILLTANHCVFDLQHHLVLSTNYRRGVFTAEVGRNLTTYWLRVAAKHNFAIDQLSSVPDHIHMRVRIVPSMSIEECALILMNNGQHFVDKHYPCEMARAGLDRLWQPSAYAGTVGPYTTGLLQKWLRLEGI